MKITKQVQVSATVELDTCDVVQAFADSNPLVKLNMLRAALPSIGDKDLEFLRDLTDWTDFMKELQDFVDRGSA